MWFEWLVRRFDMGALAVVSPLQQPSGVDQQGCENAIPQCARDTTSLWNKRKYERRMPSQHTFPPLCSPPMVSTELVSSPVWSPYFDKKPYKDLSYYTDLDGQKTVSLSLIGGANNDGGPWMSELPKNYFQTIEELKPSQFNHGSETTLEPERYKELKAGFWKRLASESPKDKPYIALSTEAPLSNEEGTTLFNPIAKRTPLSRSLGKTSSKINGSLEIEVVLTGKWNINSALEEENLMPIPDLCEGPLGNLTCKNNIQPCLREDGINQPFPTNIANNDNLCSSEAFSREEGVRDSPKQHVVERHNALQWHQNDSKCNFDNRGRIGRSCIEDDGKPTSTSSNHEVGKESGVIFGNLEYKRQEEDGAFANWCVVDSYMTGHGKETTWTVRGFEKDDGIFDENSPYGKDSNPLKVVTKDKNDSCFDDFFVNQPPFIKSPDVEARHGPLPKWTQQALQERVARNLREQQIEERSFKSVVEIVQSPVKQKDEGMNAEDNSRDKEAECQEVVFDDLIKKRKVSNKKICKGMDEDLEGGDVEAIFIDMIGNNSSTWNNTMQHSINTCVCPSNYASDHEKELLNLVAHREFRRHKREWPRKRAPSPSTTLACCASVIGDTVRALQRTREDVAALTLKLVDIQEAEVKAFKAAASKMRIHVDLLHSEVKGLEREEELSIFKIFPWQHLLRNIILGISLMLGSVGLHRAIRAFLQLLFGRVVQNTNFRKEKMIVAIIMLYSGSYIGKEMWKIFERKKKNEAIFQQKLHLVLKRLSYMSTVTYNNATTHLGQVEQFQPKSYERYCEKEQFLLEKEKSLQ